MTRAEGATVWLVDEFGHGGIGRYAVDVSNLLGGSAPTTVATSSMGPVSGLEGSSVVWFPRPPGGTAGRALGGLLGLGRAARSVRRGDAAWLPLGIRPVFELLLATVLRVRGVRLVVTVHNRGPHGQGESRTVVRAARLASAVVVHTGALEQWSSSHGLATVRLPFPPPDVQRGAGAGLTRESLGIPPDTAVVSMLGYLYAYKGVDLLVRALLQAVQRAPELPLHVLLAGRLPSGPAGAPVLAALDEAQHEPRVTLRAGWLEEDELSDLLALTDVIALPYREIDNSGSGALARSRGLPALASELPGLREIFGEAAVYVPPDDVDALADALGRLPEMLPELRTRAAEGTSTDLPAAYRSFMSRFLAGPR